MDIVFSHTMRLPSTEPTNAFFAFNVESLVNFYHWPLRDAYSFYLSNKPWPPGSEWNPVDAKFNKAMDGQFLINGIDMHVIRTMRRDAGRDANNSDAPYDPDNDEDSDDNDWW